MTVARPRLLALTLLLVGCSSDDAEGEPPADFTFTASAWPEADTLFHADPRWLGGDAAYSIDLGSDRTLWLFGDSFIATSPAGLRSESKMVRNSIAIQTGRDPVSASIGFAWKEAAGEPQSFVPEQGSEWFWPLHGLRVGDTLTLFLLREMPTTTGFGFEANGWEAVRVIDPDAPPSEWKLEPLATTKTGFPVAVGTSVLRRGDWVFAYAVQEPGLHDVYLVRWSVADFEAGNLTAPEWHDGDRGFVAQAELAGAPAPVMKGAQTELSVSWLAPAQSFVEVQTRGFGQTTVAFRKSDAVEGPWSALTDVFRPPESDREDAFVYAGKAHAELEGADLIVTYAANAKEFATLISDTSLYYPRFVKLERTALE